MKQSIKKFLLFFSILLASIAILFAFSYISFKGENIEKTTEEEPSNIQFVLVNEDKGATFGSNKYVLGSDFVTLINHDTKNHWETASRDVAERGMETGQFDAQIIIPQNFSKRILALESINPDKAIITYQVRDGQNEITNNEIQTQVNLIMKDFSQRVVKMYFSSIIGNLSEAQQNVNEMVGLETNYQNNFKNDIYLPLKEFPDSFTSITSTASILDEENKVFTIEQQAFLDTIESLMSNSQTELIGSSEASVEMQESINSNVSQLNSNSEKFLELFNQQFELHKQQLEEQWTGDTTFYKEQYDSLNTTALDQLNLFYKPGSTPSEDSGILSDFIKNIQEFNDSQQQNIGDLQGEITAIETQIDSLETLKKDIAKKYFGDEDRDTTATDEEVKDAIKGLIQLGNNNPSLPNEYKDLIVQQFNSISDNMTTSSFNFPNQGDFYQLLNTLKLNGNLSNEEELRLKDAYNIVCQYNSRNLNGTVLTPVSSNFDIITSVGGSTIKTNPNKVLKNTINLKLQVGDQEVIFESEDGIDISNFSGSVSGKIEYDMLNDINSKIGSGFIATASLSNNTDSTTTPPTKSTSMKINIVNAPTTTGTLNMDYTYTVEPNLSINISSLNTDPTNFFEENYYWKVKDVTGTITTLSKGILAVSIDKDTALKNDLSKLLTFFDQLTTTAQTLTLLYADPSQLDINNFSTYLSSLSSTDKFETLASPNSVYWLYNNVDSTKAEAIITDSLVASYRKNGEELYNQVVSQIDALEKVVGEDTDDNSSGTPTLHGTLALLKKPNTFLADSVKMKDWYTAAMQEIDKSYNSWSDSEEIDAESVSDDETIDTTPIDMINSETEAFIQNFQMLINDSKTTSELTGEAASKVKSITPDVEKLKTQTDELETNANEILAGLDKSVSDLKENTDENTSFAEEFEKVLSNARNGGADNKTFLNFLSSPIQFTGTFGSIKQDSLIPYYATMAVALVVLLVATGLQKYLLIKEETRSMSLAVSGRFGKSLHNVFLAVIISLILATLFALDSSSIINQSSKLGWIVFGFLVLFSGILLVLGSMRLFKKVTSFICGLILIIFLLLSPLLDVLPKNEVVINILCRLSPLLNIQSGFLSLYRGEGLGWKTYMLLTILSIIGILLNFMVKPEDLKSKKVVE